MIVSKFGEFLLGYKLEDSGHISSAVYPQDLAQKLSHDSC